MDIYKLLTQALIEEYGDGIEWGFDLHYGNRSIEDFASAVAKRLSAELSPAWLGEPTLIINAGKVYVVSDPNSATAISATERGEG